MEGESLCPDSFLIIIFSVATGLVRITFFCGSLGCTRFVYLHEIVSLDEGVAAVVEEEEVFDVLEGAEEED
jgi:hypothetical protein